jgi:hypothetical protein
MAAPAPRVGLPRAWVAAVRGGRAGGQTGCAGGWTGGRLVAPAAGGLGVPPAPFVATSPAPRAPKVQIQLHLAACYYLRMQLMLGVICLLLLLLLLFACRRCCLLSPASVRLLLLLPVIACCWRCYLLAAACVCMLVLYVSISIEILWIGLISILLLINWLAFVINQLISILLLESIVVKIMAREILWIGLMITSHIYVNWWLNMLRPYLFVLLLLSFWKSWLMASWITNCCLILGVGFYNIYLDFLHTKCLKTGLDELFSF